MDFVNNFEEKRLKKTLDFSKGFGTSVEKMLLTYFQTVNRQQKVD